MRLPATLAHVGNVRVSCRMRSVNAGAAAKHFAGGAVVVGELESWAHGAPEQRPRAATDEPRPLNGSARDRHLRALSEREPVANADY